MRNKANISQSVQSNQQSQMDDQSRIEKQEPMDQTSQDGKRSEKSGFDGLVNELLEDSNQVNLAVGNQKHSRNGHPDPSKSTSSTKPKVSSKFFQNEGKNQAPGYLSKPNQKQNTNGNMQLQPSQSARGPTSKAMVSPQQYKSVQGQRIAESPYDSANVEISAKPKPPKELNQELRFALKTIEQYQPNSKDYMVGMDLESQLKKHMNKNQFTSIPDELQIKVQAFIREHTFQDPEEAKDPQIASPLKSRKEIYEHLSSPQPRKVRLPSFLQGLEAGKLAVFEQLVQRLEATLSLITAKDIQRFKSLSGNKQELLLGVACLYFFISQDSQLVLTTDRKQLASVQWEDLKRYCSSSGKFIFNLKKMREQIEKDVIQNPHFAQILSHMEELRATSGFAKGSAQSRICDFIEAAVSYTRFVKEVKGVPDEQLRTPAKKAPKYQFASPKSGFMSPRSRMAQTQQFSSHKQRLMSPELKTSKDLMYQMNEELYSKETKHLVRSAMTKDKLKAQQIGLAQVSNSIKKLKFEMQREEKLALRSQEKQEEADYLKYQKESTLQQQRLAAEKAKKEKEEFLFRQAEHLLEQEEVNAYKKREAERLQKECIYYDFESENKLRETLQKQAKEKARDEAEFTLSGLRDKENLEREKQMQDWQNSQANREQERKKEIRQQMSDLKKKEKELYDEIAYLQKMKETPIKLPGAK